MSIDSTEGTVTGADGRTITYLARGPVDGVPVIYLHGMPASRLEQCLTFPDQVLDRFGLRMVSVDRPGWGRTDPLPGTRPERAADVLAVADALGIEDFAVIGVSAGGTNAITVAGIAPDRVRRVVLTSGQMPYDDDDAIAMLQPGQAATLPFLRAGRSELVESACEQTRTAALEDPLTSLGDAFSTLTARERAWLDQPRVRDALVTEMKEGFATSAEGLIQDALLMVAPFEIDLATITCPVRAVHGTADDWEPIANLHRILDQLPDVLVFEIVGLNHFGPVMQPDLLASLCAGDGPDH